MLSLSVIFNFIFYILFLSGTGFKSAWKASGLSLIWLMQYLFSEIKQMLREHTQTPITL